MGGNSYQDQYPNVFGITGKKGHGKDTFARLLLHSNNNGTSTPLRVTHFAEELKRLAAKVYGLTHDQLHKLEAKEAPLAKPIVMDERLSDLCRETGLDIKPAGCVAKSPRELMQFLGTEYVRKTQDNFWLAIVNKKITEYGGHYLVPDTRFTNEADSIRSVGGKIIKIKRLDLPDADDVHASETEMESINPDLFLGTVTDSFGLQTRVAEAILMGRFDIAQKYDYRSLQKGITEYNLGASTRDVAELLDLPLTEAEFVLDYYKVLCTNCHGYRYTEPNGSIWRGQVTEELVACELCNPNPESARYS
jgi:hypothetical protein